MACYSTTSWCPEVLATESPTKEVSKSGGPVQSAPPQGTAEELEAHDAEIRRDLGSAGFEAGDRTVRISTKGGTIFRSFEPCGILVSGQARVSGFEILTLRF